MLWVKTFAVMLALCLSLSSASAQGRPSRATAPAKPDGGAEEKPDPFKGLELRGIGPALMSGRIADIAIHPKDPNVWYVAVGSGNLWKTGNSGTTWKPVFDHQGSYSIGCVTVDPLHPEIVWVGTGENVGGRHVGYGDGVYRSLDGGETWTRMGLAASEHVGRIVVDPRSSDVVYVAAQGPLWAAGGDRGLYKTTDGGLTWKKILGGGEYTGVNDVVMDPRDSDVLYAATHQRYRNVAALIDGGPESGIHKSVDGGATWRRLKEGLPKEEMGRIGLALSPQKPDVVYATIELAHRKGGFWRSPDAGGSWEKRNDYVSGATGPHYYQEIFASPHRFDRVYQMDYHLHVTEDGGKTFTDIEGRSKHVDNHALAFRGDDPNYLLAGCDGGIYESWDLGQHWKFVANLPVTQFYKVAADNAEPFYNVYGGTQDNNSQGGPSRTDNVNGIRNSDWFVTLGADGHQSATDPTQPDIVYCEWQEGNLVRFDRRTGEIVYIQPQPGPDEPAERFNWDAPILVSPHDPARLYYASQRVWRSDDRGDRWAPISGDLTRGLDRLKLPLMGRVWSFDALWDMYAMSKYGTITSLAQSPLDEKLLYAGTDDGLIQVTEDGGAHWRRIDKLPGVPGFCFVNDIKADLFDRNTVVVAVDAHKSGDFSPYLLRSTDRGRTWKSIAGDLPKRHIVWRLVQDGVRPGLLFAGTEFGLFFTVDGGATWAKLGGGAPTIPFRDLAIQRRENDLVCASFGRGIYILDDYTPLREVSAERLKQEIELFPVRRAWWYVERRVLGDEGKASQGDAYFVAPNPPFGATFTYYLRDELKTRKERRREREKAIEKKGGDTPYPGWVALREEALESDPAIVLTVRDAAGEVARRLSGPVQAGFHRVAWDLRYPSVEPAGARRSQEEDDEPPKGVLAAPGTYTVSMARLQDGVLTDLAREQTFEVVPLRRGTLPGASPAQAVAFLRGLAALDRSVQGATASIAENMKRLAGIQEALLRSTAGDTTLDHQAYRLKRRLSALEERLSGNRQRRTYGDDGPVSIAERLRVARLGNESSTYGPTPTHRMSFEIAQQSFAELRRDLDRLIEEDLVALEKRLDAAGVPWTPGRRVPAVTR
ncbi:MAG: glycosyl hydrolase [Candidatus Eisenbacteria bacterium RBG_16_71_46]|nr:MAG: glycosyl hydrolase [Candidatus Eisenbacteria bacterium RBG_16_71_46]